MPDVGQRVVWDVKTEETRTSTIEKTPIPLSFLRRRTPKLLFPLHRKPSSAAC